MCATDDEIRRVLAENEERNRRMFAKFDPITGEGSTGERRCVLVPRWLAPEGGEKGEGGEKCSEKQGEKVPLWLPVAMLEDAEAKRLLQTTEATASGADAFERLRLRHDFAYWAAKYAYIKPKGGGEDRPFVLNYPQRKYLETIEQQRVAGKPIRIVLLKARQWGGSTITQLYMAWLQLVHCTGLNSLIIAHQGTASDEIKDMFDRMIRAYPLRLLHAPGEDYDEKEAKMVGVGRTRSTYRVPQRNCKIKIGTAERPDSCRGGDYNLVHLSEVGLWKATKGKKPEDIIRAACSGVLYKPNTMLVYESTANGVGNFFHREYVDSRDNPRAQFRAAFVSWYEIEQNRLEFGSAQEREEFAEALCANRHNHAEMSNREESGRYLWSLWERGATLEGINWYVTERSKHSQHGSMAAECPSDDTEAFVNSGAAVFDKYKVEELRAHCRQPLLRGEVYSIHGDSGDAALTDLRFREDRQGELAVWAQPEYDAALSDRYLAVVDIGGRSVKADWSVVAVFDRAPMAQGLPAEVVAQWYGHIDMDLLAWKAAQIGAYYDNALLVIESNTLETHDRDRSIDGDQSAFILSQIKDVYPNLYARRQSAEDVRQGVPRKFGFHTNIATKPMVISTLVKVVREALYVERDERCLNELLVYERKANGAFGAIAGEHDDMLMTRAIGMHISLHEMEIPGRRLAAGAEQWRTHSWM